MSLNSSFVSAIQTLHELDSEKKEVILFLDNQIENLPDYIQIVFIFATYFFDKVFIFFYFKSFQKLSLAKRVKIVAFIKKKRILPFSLIIRFYETMIILKSVEILNEK